jgi:hypothetical protein
MHRRAGLLLFSSFVLFGTISLLPVAHAQLNSTVSSVALTATLNETLTISVTPTTDSFTLVAGGTATASTPVAITTTWTLSASRANVVLVAYFSSASAALTNGSVNIPTSEVYGTVATGTPTTATAFTQSGVVGTSGAGLTLFTQALSSSNRSATRTDNLSLQINLTSQPQLPASTYTGTLSIEAQAL